MTVFIASYKFDLFNIWFLIALIGPWYIFFTVSKSAKSNESSKKKNRLSKGAIVFCSIISALVVVIAAIVINNEVRRYNNTLGAYKNGNYKEIEGYVTRYRINGDQKVRTNDEEFSINGIPFVVYDDFFASWYSTRDGYI